MYHFIQTKPNKKERWQLVDAKQVLEKTPAFKTVLGVSADPAAYLDQGIDPNDHVKYLGPMYFDLDGTDINEVLKEAVNLVDTLKEDWGIDPNLMSIYLSGKKGIHLTIPEKLFGVRSAILHLPYIWKKFAEKFEGKSIDRGVYSTGNGRMWRCSGVKRPDTGTYKVQVSEKELRRLDVDSYAELVSEARPDFSPVVAEDPIPKLESTLSALKILVKADLVAMKKASHNITSEDLRKVEGVPGCIEILITEGDQADSNWNQAAMQLAGYIAARYDKEEDGEYIPLLVDPFLDNVESSGRPERREREKAVKDLLHRAFMGRIKFSIGGIIHAIGKKCGACVVCCENASDKEVEEGEFYDEDTRIKICADRILLVGENSSRELGNFGIEQNINFLEADSFRQLRSITGFYEITLKSGVQYKVEIPESSFTDRRAFPNSLSGTGAIFSGNESELQLFGVALHNMRRSRGVEEMIRTKTSGILFHEENEEAYPNLITSEHSYARNNLPSKFTYVGPKKLSPSFEKVPDFSTVEEVKELEVALTAILNMNDTNVMMPALGWTMAAHLKTHLTYGSDPTFPLLSLCGTSESGKSSTMFLLLALNGFPYRQVPFWNAEVDTMYPLEEMVSTSSTFIRMIDEANEHNAKRNWSKLVGLLKSSWDGGDIMKGGISGRTVTTTALPNKAPIVYLSEQSFPIQSIRTRSIECHFSSRAMQNKEYEGNFKKAEERHKYLEMFAKVLATTALNTSLTLIGKWVAEAEKLVPEAYRGRTKRAYLVTLVGLRFLADTVHVYSKELSEAILIKRDEWVFREEENAETLVKTKRHSALDDILQAFDTMAAEYDNPQHGLEVGQHYWVQNGILSIDLRSIFPRFRRYARGLGIDSTVSSAGQVKQLIQGEVYFEGITSHPYKPMVEIIMINLEVLRSKGTIITNFQDGEPSA